MIFDSTASRREFLRLTSLLTAATAFRPAVLLADPSQGDRVAEMRAQAAKIEIRITPLRGNLFLLQGAGGNMVAQTGKDGQLLVDASFSTAVPRVLAALKSLSPDSFNTLINTHWHFDHTDGNAGLHQAGATIIAHENTYKRLTKPQELAVLHMKIPAAPEPAWPKVTFQDALRLRWNDDTVNLVHFAPAHTDSDIYVHFSNQNVLHIADIWFNGFYPVIDLSTGGNINGMIHAASNALALADNDTKIIPGHGPLGDKAALTGYCDMLVTVRDRVAALKQKGASLDEVKAQKPTADLDAAWGHGLVPAELFLLEVYNSL